MDHDPGPEAIADDGPADGADDGAAAGTGKGAHEGSAGHAADAAIGDHEGGTAEESEDGAEGADGSTEDGEVRDPLRFNNWMKRSATGAVMTGIAVGLQQALQLPRQEPAFVIEASGEPHDPNRPIDLHFDPDNPADTVAIIRRPAPKAAPEEPSPPA